MIFFIFLYFLFFLCIWILKDDIQVIRLQWVAQVNLISVNFSLQWKTQTAKDVVYLLLQRETCQTSRKHRFLKWNKRGKSFPEISRSREKQKQTNKLKNKAEKSKPYRAGLLIRVVGSWNLVLLKAQPCC